MGTEPRRQCGSAAIYTLIMWCITTAAENILENLYKMQNNNKGNNVTECCTDICILPFLKQIKTFCKYVSLSFTFSVNDLFDSFINFKLGPISGYMLVCSLRIVYKRRM